MLALMSAVNTMEQDGTIKNKIYFDRIKKRYIWTNLSFYVSFCCFCCYYYNNNIYYNKGSDVSLSLILISMFRYFVSGLFIFSIFNNSNKNFIKNTIVPSIIHAISLALFKLFVIDHPVIIFASFLVIFGCLLVAYKPKIWKVSLTYSLFLTCVLEYTHFGIFKIVSHIWEKSGIPDVTYTPDINLILFRLAVFVTYILIVMLIYTSNKINVTSIRQLAQYNIFNVFLGIALYAIMYLKYHIKYTESNKFHDVLSIIFVFFIVLCLTFLFSSETFLEKIENFQKKKTNQAIEEAKLQKGKSYPGLRFLSPELNHQAESFKNGLSLIGMDTEDKKAKQLIHGATLLSKELFPAKVNMVSRIYPYTGQILGLQPKSIETNISNLLKNHWSSYDPTILKKIKQHYHGPISEENGAPTPKQFLLYLVKEYKEDTSLDKTTEKFDAILSKNA